jgi:hypothetical protein
LELAGLVGDRVEHVLREPDLFADLDQHPAEVDDDLSVGGRDVVSDIVFEDRQNGPVGCPVGVLPDGPQRRAVEQRFGGVDERIAQYPCQRATETLELFGKLLIDRRTDIHVLVERVDQPDRHLPAHVVVVEQLRARVHPGVGVEELALDPRVQGAQHHHDRAEDDQQPHHGAMRRLPFDLVGRSGHISRGSVIHAHSSSSLGWCFQPCRSCRRHARCTRSNTRNPCGRIEPRTSSATRGSPETGEARSRSTRAVPTPVIRCENHPHSPLPG